MPYYPKIPVSIESVADLRAYVEDELKLIAEQFQQHEILDFRILAAAPNKIHDGMVIYVDGVNFNPGSGRGLYERRSGIWVKL